jgi:hypothetical protein
MTATPQSGTSGAGGKTKVSDFPPTVRRRLLKAMFIYESHLYAMHAFPSPEHQIDWINRIWELMNEHVLVKHDLTAAMLKLVRLFISDLYHCISQIMSQIKERGSRARGFLKDITRPHIEDAYGFSPSAGRKGIQKNRDRYMELMRERSFHYKVCKVATMRVC